MCLDFTNISVNIFFQLAEVDHLRKSLVPQLQDVEVADKWFQQDEAICHTTGQTINLLREAFGITIISRNGPVN